MNDSPNNLDKTNCAFVGESVIVRGSIVVAGMLVILGMVEGDVEANELVIGTNGTVKGNVRVDQALVQGTILENIEARDCLRLRRTGRIEGTATYGEIEIERGGVLVGRASERSGEGAERLRAPSVSVAEIRSASAVSADEDRAVSL